MKIHPSFHIHHSLRVEKQTKHAAQKMKFSIKDFFSKFDKTTRTVELLTFAEKALMENFIFWAVAQNKTLRAFCDVTRNCISHIRS